MNVSIYPDLPRERTIIYNKKMTVNIVYEQRDYESGIVKTMPEYIERVTRSIARDMIHFSVSFKNRNDMPSKTSGLKRTKHTP